MRAKLEAPLKKLGLTVDAAMVLYKDVLPGRKIGCTAFVFNATVVSYLLLAESSLGSIGTLLYADQTKLIRPLVRSTAMEVEEADLKEDSTQDQLWPALPGSNPYAAMKVNMRHPLDGEPLLPPNLLDLLPFQAVFQCNAERVGPSPVLAIQHFVAGDITSDVVIGYVVSEIIATLSEHFHREHEYLTFEYWEQRVGVQHVWHKGVNTICRILIVVASGRQHQLIVDRFHGTFFPWDTLQRQVVYVCYVDCVCIGCQTRRKREYGFGCMDCGSTSHLAKDASCPQLQERMQRGDLRRAQREQEAAGTSGQSVQAENAGETAKASQEVQNVMGGKQGSGRGGVIGRGRGGRGTARTEYNWLCGFCHKPNGALYHNSKYCVKPFVLPPLSELPKSACLFCNHDHFFLRCPILMEQGSYILPNAYVNMARELKYPVMEVRGQPVINIAASLPRLLDTSQPGSWSGGSSASSQASSEGAFTGSEIILSGGEDPKSMQLQLQQALSTLGDRLMLEMGRQLTDRLGEVTASMSQLSQAHGQLQERVLQQTTTTTEMFSTLQQRVEDCRREAKEAQEKGDKKLEDAMKRMAAVAKSMVGDKKRGGKGAGGDGVKDLASTTAMGE